ncbi:hypothetical protein [Devosia sediminis]|uniref:Uncharacterized protein n=1 Tax=Devosia sediminis TaxID=2798801 RepID=A0A934MSF8_9HYPH|nr:hypothetical protein [Devosia sediminis]MBJ3786409.1 hypothetical protein [Devosia sediminis]
MGILSKNGNGLVGDKIDLPLIQAFQSVMTLLNGSRDRGQNQPTRMTDESGSTYVVEFGEPLKMDRPDYREEQIDGGTAIHIAARNLKELRTLLGRVKANHPDFDIDEAIKHAVTEQSWPDGMLHGQLQIGPRVVFPALFVSASIFAVHHGHPPHPDLQAYIGRFDPESPEMPPGTFYFIPSQPWISAPGKVTHIVALMASAERHEMLVYFELLNAVAVGVRMPYAGKEDARASYAVDILTGTEVNPSIDEEALAGVRWHATHKLGDHELYEFTQERMGRLIGVSQERAFEAEFEDLMTRAFGKVKDGPFTPADLAEGIREILDHTLLHWQRPTMSLDVMEEQLQQLEEFMQEMERLVSAPARVPFGALMNGFRRRLASEIARKRRPGTPDATGLRPGPAADH